MEKLVTDNLSSLTRSVVAKRLKINAETLRYYEAQKLINKPNRLANNYRVYTERDIKRLQFILMAKNLGLTLSEIRELLRLSLNEKANRAKIRAIAQRKSQLMHEKITQLSKIKIVLDKLITSCLNNETTDKCPILQCLTSR